MSKQVWYMGSVSIPGVGENIHIKFQFPVEATERLNKEVRTEILLQVRNLRVCSPTDSAFQGMSQEELPGGD